MSKVSSKFDQTFEIGRLYADRGDFELAMPKLLEASKGYLEERNFQGYLESETLILRIHAEREELEKIQAFKERLQDLVLQEGFELTSKTYYTLALCAGYRGQSETALEYLQKALAIALAHDNKADICYAILGIAICYKNLGRLTDALKEIYNLEVFFQVLEISEVKINAQFLNAQILNELKRHDEANEVLWQAYDQIKVQKNMTLHIFVLYYLGCTYAFKGEKEMARAHLKLADNAVDTKNYVRLAKAIKKSLKDLGGDTSDKYDLVFELANHSILEKKLGRVDFKNQFILLDLLKLFVQNQGQVYSKEYLVENVWKQPYDPAVHDNKIYVTIKRLRKMIEPDYDKPKYIFRAKNGYFMNKSARVLIEQRGTN